MTQILSPADLYHTGVVVADLATAKAEMSQLGYEFGFGTDVMPPEQQGPMPVLLPEGPSAIDFRFSYTKLGPHRIELVQAIPGTIWEYLPGRLAHHIGYWCDDIPATSARLEAAGCPWTVKIGAGSAEDVPMAVMHQTASGLHIELVSSAVREAMFGE